MTAPSSVQIIVQYFQTYFGRNLLVRNRQRNGDLLAKPWSRRATIESQKYQAGEKTKGLLCAQRVITIKIMAYMNIAIYPRKLCEKTLTLTDAPKYVLKPCRVCCRQKQTAFSIGSSREKVVFMAFFVTFLLLQATGK